MGLIYLVHGDLGGILQHHKNKEPPSASLLANFASQESNYFEDAPILWPTTCNHIAALYHLIPEELATKPVRVITPEVIDENIPWAYFDGLAQNTRCGGGVVLHITESHYYKLKMGLGNFAELNSLRLLIFALEQNCNNSDLWGF